MSEPLKKPNQTPESYTPKEVPVIMKLAEQAVSDSMVNGEEVPFLFRKEIIHLPKSLLIGKKVTYPIKKQGKKGKKGNPPLSLLWDACGKDGTFAYLDEQKGSAELDGHWGLYYDINKNNDGNFSYLVGVLMKEGTVAPEGYACREMPESDVAVCWFRYGEDGEIWAKCDPNGITAKFMEEQGYIGNPEAGSPHGWCSELYLPDSHPTANGEYVLCYLISCQKKEND